MTQESKSSGLASLAKGAAIGASALYCVGLLVESAFAALLKIESPYLFEARYVLTGFVYLLWLFIPIAPMVVVGVLLFKMDLPAKIDGFVMRMLLCVAVCLGFYFVLPVPLSYFVSPGLADGLSFSAARNSFFGLYVYMPWFNYAFFLFWLPVASAIAVMINLDKAIRLRHGFVLVLVLCWGIICTLVPYCITSYLSIRYAIGGGGPSVVYVRLSDKVAADVQEELRFSGPKELVTFDNLVGPVLLWPSRGDYVYLSAAKHPMTSSMVAIAKEEVESLVLTRGSFRATTAEVRIFPGGDDLERLRNRLVDQARELGSTTTDSNNAVDKPDSR